jgi:hypothetical protein
VETRQTPTHEQSIGTNYIEQGEAPPTLGSFSLPRFCDLKPQETPAKTSEAPKPPLTRFLAIHRAQVGILGPSLAMGDEEPETFRAVFVHRVKEGAEEKRVPARAQFLYYKENEYLTEQDLDPARDPASESHR